MGKGTIISGGANGLYTLNVDYGDALRQQYLTQINKRLSELNSALPLAEAKVIDQNATISSADNTVQAAISAYNAALLANPEGQYPELQKAIQDAVTAYAAEVAKLKPLQGEVNVLKSEQTSLGSRSSYLNSLNLIKVAPAWCVDLTENATGQVATIEIPGEPDKVLIAPGAPQPQNTDGQVLARDVLREDQAFLNAALLPGWQKWKPTFRIGTITFVNKDANTCSVDVQYTESSANQLPINQTEFLSGVPIDYMDCDASVFEEGDQVVIRFDGQNWNNPKVVGFVSNPKGCSLFEFNGVVRRYPTYYHSATWTGNTNPDFSPSGWENLGGFDEPLSEYPYPSKPDNVSLWVTSIYMFNEIYLTYPKSLALQLWNNREAAVVTVNNNTATLFDAFAYCRFDIDEYYENQQPDDWGGDDRFYSRVYIGEATPDSYAVQPCDKSILDIYIQQEIWPGPDDGGDVRNGNVYGVAPESAATIFEDKNNEFDISIELDGSTLFTANVIAKKQTVSANGYVCLFETANLPDSNWIVSGSGFSVPDEVTWIQKI